MQRHAPVKPLWFCAACAHPWPCGQGRLDLLSEYAGDRRSMAIDLADLLYEATRDLSRLYPKPPDAFGMYGRFLGWTRRRSQDLSPNCGYFD
ncbi:flavin reductase [Micromonospora chersina]